VVTNEGTKATTGPITVTDTLQPEFTYVSATGPGWDCTATVAPNVSCTHLGPLAPGASLPPITLVATLNTPAFILLNTATVTTEDDAIPDNDSDTFFFSLLERTAPVLSGAGIAALIAMLTLVAYFGFLRAVPKKR